MRMEIYSTPPSAQVPDLESARNGLSAILAAVAACRDPPTLTLGIHTSLVHRFFCHLSKRKILGL